MIETFLSAVSVAECDEMGHMNIQHYAARAGDAAAVLAALNGAASPREPEHVHLRFHKEMLAGDRLRVRSGRVGEGDSPALLHLIENAGTKLTCATCIATYDNGQMPDAPEGDMPDAARPRSLTDSALPVNDGDEARAMHMAQTHLAPILPGDCGIDGSMTIAAFLSRVSRCQAHLWALAGLDRRMQAERGLGTATLELRVWRQGPVRAGSAIRILTAFEPPAGKTLTYEHRAFDAATGTPLFTALGTGVVMDLATRRAVKPPVPDTQIA